MDSPITTLIVDDEPAARRTLHAALQKFGFVRVIGEASNVADAARIALDRKPELVFLDVTMPVRSGFELLPHLQGRAQVVFVTAFDTYAVRAFEFHAIDYLLKPIRPDRLALAMERIRTARHRGRLEAAPSAPIKSEEVVLQAEGNVRVVPVGSIAFVKAVGNYTQVNLTGGARVLLRRSMEEWQEILPTERFLRPHRSLILNLGLMKGVRAVSRDVAEVSLDGCETPITVGRQASLLLRRVLQQMESAPVRASAMAVS